MTQSQNDFNVCWPDIVAPTLAEAHRAARLMQAIDSVQNQSGRAFSVIKGDRFDTFAKKHPECLEGIGLLGIAEASLQNAIRLGRHDVSSEYFDFFLDDDYLLPGAIALRESFLDHHPQVDTVVKNCLQEEWADDPQLFKSRAGLDQIEQDPPAALLTTNHRTEVLHANLRLLLHASSIGICRPLAHTRKFML